MERSKIRKKPTKNNTRKASDTTSRQSRDRPLRPYEGIVSPGFARYEYLSYLNGGGAPLPERAYRVSTSEIGTQSDYNPRMSLNEAVINLAEADRTYNRIREGSKRVSRENAQRRFDEQGAIMRRLDALNKTSFRTKKKEKEAGKEYRELLQRYYETESIDLPASDEIVHLRRIANVVLHNEPSETAPSIPNMRNIM